MTATFIFTILIVGAIAAHYWSEIESRKWFWCPRCGIYWNHRGDKMWSRPDEVTGREECEKCRWKGEQ